MGHQFTYWRSRAIIVIYRFWKYFSGSGKAPSRSGNTPNSRRNPRHAAQLITKADSTNISHTRQHMLFSYKAYACLCQTVVQSNPFASGSGLRDAHASVQCPLLIWAMGGAYRPVRRLKRRGLTPRAPYKARPRAPRAPWCISPGPARLIRRGLPPRAPSGVLILYHLPDLKKGRRSDYASYGPYA